MRGVRSNLGYFPCQYEVIVTTTTVRYLLQMAIGDIQATAEIQLMCAHVVQHTAKTRREATYLKTISLNPSNSPRFGCHPRRRSRPP